MDKRREQQARTESKTRAVVRINISLQSGDYSRALDLLRGVAAEFPNDAELSELEKLAQDGIQRTAEANRLITESQELFAQQKFAKAIQLLREAYALDKNNALARSILANALVEHAQSIVDTDWWEAETLANEALVLNPAHPTAKTIPSLILDKKKAGSVDEWVAQTSKLQAAGNLSAALSQIAEGFAVFPHEPRLLQIQDAIQRDHSTQRRQARRRDLDELRRMSGEIDGVADAVSKNKLAERVRAMTVKHSTDGEILSVANALLLRLGQVGVVQKNAAASPDREGATLNDSAPASGAAKASLAALDLSPTIPVLPKQAPPIPTPLGSAPAAAAPVSKPPVRSVPPVVVSPVVAPPVVPPVVVQPVVTPPDIVAPDVVPPSKVPATPAKPQPRPPQTASVPVAEPAAPAAKVRSPSSQPKQPARSNSTTLIVAAAAATVVVAAIFFFARKHQAPPVAKGPVAAPTISAPAPSNPAVSAPAVMAPPVATPAQIAPEPSGAASQPTSDTAAGRVTPEDQPPAQVQGHDLGTLIVVADQDNARVFLNGKPQRQLTQGGQLRLPNLELKDYVVQVSKSGFQDPPPQKIRIRGGEQARLSFNLQPHLRLASLTIQGGIPGTTVLVDQATVGTIQPDGTLSVSTVNPGDHTVQLRKERFKPRQFKKHFVVGGAISLAAADAALEAVPSELKITFTPADAKVVIAKTGVLPTMVSSGVALNLAAGTYTLTARNPDSFTRYATFEVLGGQSKNLDLSLAPNGMSKWEDPGAWKHEGDAFIRKGGDFVLYGVAPTSGTFVLSAMLLKGHLLQWVVNYTDPKNYVLFQMDDNGFHRTVIHNGAKSDEVIVPDKSDKKSFRTLHIRVSSTEIVHQIKHGDRWVALDRWTQPGGNLGAGKFGFYIPGNDEVALSGFAHYVDLNIR